MKLENKLIVTNPFKFYRYEIPNIIMHFGFSTATIQTRIDRDDEGWDNITNITPINTLPENNQLRLKPFLEGIDEQFYLENCNIIDYQDCIITQDWAKQPSADTLLYNMLNEEKDIIFPEKITKEFFLDAFFNEKYFHSIRTTISFDDIESFTMKFLFLHDTYEDDVELVIDDIVFTEPAAIKYISKDDDPYLNTVYIDESIFKYYFDINTMGKNVTTLLQQEYLITPAMVLDYELYDIIQHKIAYIDYEAVSHF